MAKDNRDVDAETARAQRVIVSLLAAADSTRRHLSRAVEPHGLTLQQYNVLRILRGAAPDPLPTMEIGERMLERTPGVTRFLDHLEEEGLVRRERCPSDRRRVDAWITSAGLEVLAAMDSDVEHADREVITDLSAEGTEELTALLTQITRNTS